MSLYPTTTNFKATPIPLIEHKNVAGDAAGSALKDGAIGAVAGAAVGSFVPVVGTAAGAVIGGLIGIFAGAAGAISSDSTQNTQIDAENAQLVLQQNQMTAASGGTLQQLPLIQHKNVFGDAVGNGLKDGVLGAGIGAGIGAAVGSIGFIGGPLGIATAGFGALVGGVIGGGIGLLVGIGGSIVADGDANTQIDAQNAQLVAQNDQAEQMGAQNAQSQAQLSSILQQTEVGSQSMTPFFQTASAGITR